MEVEFNDRFADARYVEDQPVHVFRADRHAGQGSGDEAWIPERLWSRIRLVGAAYELRLLPLLDGTVDPIFINAVQSAELARELDFVTAVLNDPIVHSTSHRLHELMRLPSQGASKDHTGFEFP